MINHARNGHETLAPSLPAQDSGRSLDDPRVHQAMEEYLKLLEKGERPDRTAFLERYPQIADALAVCLDGLDFVHGAGHELSEPGALDQGAAAPRRALGDFRLLREVGRGGMGVVYEAEQLSLGRRVALKVLPLAATLDPRQLQRFHNEARAAASLHHEHIVPVYAVGQERGVHYYAMQFIDGQTLADVIRGQRGPAAVAPADTPTVTQAAAPPAAETAPVAAAPTATTPRDRAAYRRAAELIAEAAEALEHAHALGVVHRDIKPANLLLDARGKLWVTDFGLARLGTDAGVTLTGDLLGTLRYMSPEQALARHGLVDHRTDIYALGATLYELLTLQPALNGIDREELLRQIIFEEPRAPRRLDKGVPADLETIVLKAMAKYPAERYATARDLADDLRRWLGDQPIRARRPTLVQRVQKWLRRHPSVQWASVAALLVVAVAASVSAVVVNGERLKTQAALAAESKRRQQARDALDAMTSQLMEDWLGKQDELLPEHKAFLDKALASYEEFAADTGQDEAARAGVASAYLRAGKIRIRLGLRDDAQRANDRARQLFTQLTVDFPTVAAYRKGLADSHYALAMCRMRDAEVRKSYAEVEAAHRAALTLRQQLVAEFPGVAEYRFDLSVSHVGLGDLLRGMGRLEEAEKSYRAAQDLRVQLFAEFPTESRYEFEVAGAGIDLVPVLLKTGRKHEAEEAMRSGVAILRRHAADTPSARNRMVLGWAYRNQGEVLVDIGKPKEAEEAYRAALAVDKPLVAEFPKFHQYRFHLARAHVLLGELLRNQGRPEEAIAEFREAIRRDPEDPAAHLNLGLTLQNLGQFAEALEEWRLGHQLGQKEGQSYPSAAWVQRCEQLVKLDGKLPALLKGETKPADAAECLALAVLCQMTPAKQLFAAAARWYAEAFAAEPKLASDLEAGNRYNAACAAALAGCGQGKDAASLDEKERARLRQQALDWLKSDLQDWQQLLQKEPAKASPMVYRQMRHRLQDSDFDGVRGPEALAKLPEAERQPWQQLWTAVADTLAKSPVKDTPPARSGEK